MTSHLREYQRGTSERFVQGQTDKESGATKTFLFRTGNCKFKGLFAIIFIITFLFGTQMME